eukprot:8749468-Alexandrium_andersonii.AAC.1
MGPSDRCSLVPQQLDAGATAAAVDRFAGGFAQAGPGARRDRAGRGGRPGRGRFFGRIDFHD